MHPTLHCGMCDTALRTSYAFVCDFHSEKNLNRRASCILSPLIVFSIIQYPSGNPLTDLLSTFLTAHACGPLSPLGCSISHRSSPAPSLPYQCIALTSSASRDNVQPTLPLFPPSYHGTNHRLVTRQLPVSPRGLPSTMWYLINPHFDSLSPSPLLQPRAPAPTLNLDPAISCPPTLTSSSSPSRAHTITSAVFMPRS